MDLVTKAVNGRWTDKFLKFLGFVHIRATERHTDCHVNRDSTHRRFEVTRVRENECQVLCLDILLTPHLVVFSCVSVESSFPVAQHTISVRVSAAPVSNPVMRKKSDVRQKCIVFLHFCLVDFLCLFIFFFLTFSCVDLVR